MSTPLCRSNYCVESDVCLFLVFFFHEPDVVIMKEYSTDWIFSSVSWVYPWAVLVPCEFGLCKWFKRCCSLCFSLIIVRLHFLACFRFRSSKIKVIKLNCIVISLALVSLSCEHEQTNKYPRMRHQTKCNLGCLQDIHLGVLPVAINRRLVWTVTTYRFFKKLLYENHIKGPYLL